MRLQKASRFHINSAALAFLIPCLGMLCVRLLANLFDGNPLSMLYSDCYHQYYPFFKAFRAALLRGDSLLYSWDVGLGMDYLGLISYYLASPLNLLSVLVPESWTLEFFSLLMPVKLGFAGLFFTLFLKKITGRHDLSTALFGCFYALCAWALGYQWNIMWLDTFALLPLVILGMVSLLKERKFVLYTLTLFLSIYANYYIGFFTCIFVLLTFICYEICRWAGCRKFFIDLMLMALFSALAIGMTAILSLPTLAALQNTQSSVNKFPEEFRLNIADEHTWKGLLDAMRQVAGNTNGGLEVNYKASEGLPNLYCGVGTNLLAILFLTCHQVKLRDKICSVVLLLFLNVSFIIRQLDYIWHGFHFTNMIPYRFSFLYSFVLLYMAYRAWMYRRSFRVWQIVVASILAVGLVFCSEAIDPFLQLLRGELHMLDWYGWGNILSNLGVIAENSLYFLYNLLFLTGYIVALAYGVRGKAPVRKSEKAAYLTHLQNKRGTSRIILLSAMVIDLTLILVTFGTRYSFTSIGDYPMGKEDTADVISYMKRGEEGALFYRAETTHTQTLNDGALNGYHGISTFTSSANVSVTEFMQTLGYSALNTYNRYCFEEASPVSNLFLGLKYMIDRSGSPQSNPYFDDIYASGKTHLLLNNAYLPLGFMTHPQILNVDFSSGENAFLFQNELMQKATGNPADCWNLLANNQLTIHGSNLTLTAQNKTGYCNYKTDAESGKVTYHYTADRDGLFCFYIHHFSGKNFAVYLNDAETALYSETYSLPQMLSACTVKPGDVIRITFTCAAGQSGTINMSAAILDDAVFRRDYDILNSSAMNLTVFENTYVEGTVDCAWDGVLYTSIPQDGNWTATVDGEPVQTVLIGDAMVGVNLSAGKHTVAFRYKNKAFSLGWKVSLSCTLLFIAIWYFYYKPKFLMPAPRKGKFQK